MHDRVKGYLKRILPPTTLMLDRRVDQLLEENRVLRDRIGEVSQELFVIRNELYSLRADRLRERMRERSSTELEGSPETVVSIASYGPRVPFIAPMIESLGRQSIRPDRAFLWLPTKDFPGGVDDLPADVLCALYDANVEPRFVGEDLGPHNKYYWTMRAFSESVVVTLDDDVRYPKSLLERLLDAHRAWPAEVVAMRARVIAAEDKRPAPYETWPLELGDLVGRPSFSVVGTGVGGVLYPPHCLDNHVFDIEGIRSACPRADDLWLKIMSVIAGTMTVCPTGDCPLDYLPGTQETALCDENLYQGGNDAQLAAILEYVSAFTDVGDILRKISETV